MDEGSEAEFTPPTCSAPGCENTATMIAGTSLQPRPFPFCDSHGPEDLEPTYAPMPCLAEWGGYIEAVDDDTVTMRIGDSVVLVDRAQLSEKYDATVITPGRMFVAVGSAGQYEFAWRMSLWTKDEVDDINARAAKLAERFRDA